MKNSFVINGGNAEIHLHVKDGDPPQSALIDLQDLPKAQSINGWWRAQEIRKTGKFYATANVWRSTEELERLDIKRRFAVILMHRFILDTSRGQHVDHKNHLTLDNRRSNIRSVSPFLNSLNREKEKTPRKNGNRYYAEVVVMGKTHRLGSFFDENEARIANAAVRTFIDSYFCHEETSVGQH